MGGSTTARSRNLHRVAAVIALTAFCWMATQSGARAAQINTFEGTCTNIPATAFWEKPQTWAVEENHWTIYLDGGSCDGKVNGHEVHGLPQQGRVDMYAPMSCGGGLLHGRSHTQIDGKDFYTSVQERRFGRDGALTAEGDAGGYMLLHGHGRVGLVKDDQPPGDNPLLEESGVSAPMTVFEFMDACNGSGLTTAKTQVDQAITMPTTSSPAREPGSSHDPFSPAPADPPSSSAFVPPV
jgi:hypothetical protein